jgi:hypothetical protein
VRSDATSLPVMMIRILPSSARSSPNGAAPKPTSSGHGLRDRCGNVAGRGGLGRELVLRDEREQAGMARRPGQGIGHRLAVEILDLLDRRTGRHVPIEIGRPDHLAADDADRRALGKGADGGRDAGRSRDIHAAADHRLDRFRAGLDVENLEIEPMLLEDAAALAELGDAGVPGTTLRDGDPQRVFRPGALARAGNHRERAKRGSERSLYHYASSHGRPACILPTI